MFLQAVLQFSYQLPDPVYIGDSPDQRLRYRTTSARSSKQERGKFTVGGCLYFLADTK